MEREKEEKPKKMVLWWEECFCWFFKKRHVVTLSPTTKIFVLENELTKKEVRV